MINTDASKRLKADDISLPLQHRYETSAAPLTNLFEHYGPEVSDSIVYEFNRRFVSTHLTEVTEQEHTFLRIQGIVSKNLFLTDNNIIDLKRAHYIYQFLTSADFAESQIETPWFQQLLEKHQRQDVIQLLDNLENGPADLASLPAFSNLFELIISEMERQSVCKKIASHSEGFVPLFGEEVYSDSTMSGYQGRLDFRQLIINLTKQDPQVFSPENLRTIGQLTPALYKVLQGKIAGHLYNLQGPIPGSHARFEGFNEAFTIPFICSSLERFALAHPEHLSLDKATWVIDQLKNSVHSETITDSEKALYIKKLQGEGFNQPLVVNSGYMWHSATLLLYKDLLFLCNRGAGSVGRPGICQYTLEKDADWPTLLSPLFSRLEIKNVWDFLEIMKEAKKKFNNFNFLRHPLQKGGNCTFASVSLLVIVLLAIHNSDSTQNIDLVPAKNIYKAWKAFYRKTLLEDLKNDLNFFQNNEAWHLAVPLKSLIETIAIKLYNPNKVDPSPTSG